MSETAVQSVAAEVDQWLSSFDEALAQGDTAAAAELFLDDSYWRDLVAFTWNLKTVEGPDGVRDLLEHTLARTRGRAAGAPPRSRTEADGVTEAWLAFETEVGRGSGHLRLKDGKAWTLLTDARRAQGPRGGRGAPTGRRASSTAPIATARPGSRQRAREAEELGYATQP